MLGFFFLFFIALGWRYRTLRLLKTMRLMPAVASCSPPTGKTEKISVIIPMKNEEANARACVKAFLAQDYPDFEVIAVNDNSSDLTEDILKSLPIHYINAPPKPEGWTGKNFAIHQAVPKASGEWFLFTDADTRHEKSSLSSALAHAQNRGLDFLTLLPRCLTGSFLENMIQPLAMALLGLWFPIEKINNPDSALYFANGQYLLIRRGLYEKLCGHEAVRGEFLEDFALARKAKEIKARTECALGKAIYGTRMYNSLDAIWRGWRRIYLHAFKKNARALAARAVETVFLSVVPFLMPALFLFPGLPFKSGIIFSGFLILVFVILIISWKAYKIVDGKPAFAFLHPLAAVFIAFFLLDASFIAATGRKTVWR